MTPMSMTASRRAILAGVVGSAAATRVAAAAPDPAIWYQEYAATKQRDGKTIRLQMYRKRLGQPQPGEAARPVLFLVH